MEKRLQEINGDTVLEITETATTKIRHSENDLMRKRDYLIEAINRFQLELDEVYNLLSQIDNERIKTC